MVRASVSLVVAAFVLAACSSVKSYELGLRGSAGLNPNEDDQPNPVQVRVLRLKGDEAAKVFGEAPFDDLWSKPGDVPGLLLDGAPQSVYVAASDKRIPVALKEVPPQVTHFGLLGLFNKPETGKDRLLVPRDQIDDADVLLIGNTIGAPAPAPAPATSPARQD